MKNVVLVSAAGFALASAAAPAAPFRVAVEKVSVDHAQTIGDCLLSFELSTSILTFCLALGLGWL